MNVMITISVKHLLSAIDEADAFKLPDMTPGTEYVYNSIYKKLLRGEELRLSGINFSSFDLDDIDTIRELYTNVLEAGEMKTDKITDTLWRIEPVAAASAFV